MAERQPADTEYERAIAVANALYADVLSALSNEGYDAAITQTGGMCLAIEITLTDGRSVLVTDKDEILPWERSEHSGWGLGLYGADDGSGPIQFLAVDDGSPSALVAALTQFDID